MPIPLPAAPPVVLEAVIEIMPVGPAWRMTSSDGLFFGLFRDRTSALRHAQGEAECHPGHVVVIRDESLAA